MSTGYPTDVHAVLRQRYEPEPNTGCWLWTGEIDRLGYGRLPAYGKKLSAHREAYRDFIGAIPPGMSVLHRCDVRCCVNPDHLFLGTQRDNMQDAAAKGRIRCQKKTHCLKGHPLDGTYLQPNGRPRRYCKECSRQESRARRKRASHE